MEDRSGLVADWGDLLPSEAIDKLASVIRQKGTPQLHASVSSVDVPLSVAMLVFAKRSIPEYLRRVRKIYPQVDSPSLTPAQRTALVSLVYNRGTKLTGDDRREMKVIQDLLAAGQIGAVAAELKSMTRLWTTPDVRGVALRRLAEAALWESGFASVQLD